MLGTPAGMVKHPDSFVQHTRAVPAACAGTSRWGSPYTARLMYDDDRNLDGPFSLTPQVRSSGYDVAQA